MSITNDSMNGQQTVDIETLRRQLERERSLPENLLGLRNALMKAQDQLLEQGAALTELTAAPYAAGIVLSVNHKSTSDKYRAGVRVRVVDPDSPFDGNTGKIVWADLNQDREVKVRIAGEDHWFPVLGYEDRIPHVELIDSEHPRNRRNFRAGLRVRVYLGEGIGNVGTIDHGPDGDGDVFVRFSPGREGFYRAGDDPEADRQEFKPDIVPLVTGDTVMVVTSNGILQLQYPAGMDLEPGDSVLLSMQTMQIVDKYEVPAIGDTVKVEKILGGGLVEVEIQGSTRVVSAGRVTNLEQGARVVLDSTQSIILMNLGKEDMKYRFTASTGVRWEDIGGLVEAKRVMQEIVELPHRQPELYRFYGKKPAKGVLLYGPPGVGKTMLGKATATALAEIYGSSEATGFFYLKGPEVLDRFVGVAEATIRALFAQARKFKETHGYAAIIFIDEADAILGRRGSGISSDVEKTIVPMFLTEMDGLEDSGAIVILATNRADVLDEAIVRDGRIDRKIRIDRPSEDITAAIFELYLRNVPLNNGYTVQELSMLAAAELYSAKYPLYAVQLRNGEVMQFGLQHLVSGAMVAGIVDQATSIAMRRDIDEDTMSGMRPQDLMDAVAAVAKQNAGLGHTNDLSDFVHDFRNEVVGINKLSQSAGRS